jgi:hypothetical protein
MFLLYQYPEEMPGNIWKHKATESNRQQTINIKTY